MGAYDRFGGRLWKIQLKLVGPVCARAKLAQGSGSPRHPGIRKEGAKKERTAKTEWEVSMGRYKDSRFEGDINPSPKHRHTPGVDSHPGLNCLKKGKGWTGGGEKVIDQIPKHSAKRNWETSLGRQ